MISTLLFLYGIIGTGSHGDGGATLPLTNAVKINWDGLPDVVAQAIPTYLDQVNPSMDRESPMHDIIFKRMDKLGAKLVRYLHWSASEAPFPEREEGVFNFTLTDQYVLDFMGARNAEGSVMNFDAPPCWLHQKNDCSTPFRDPTGVEFGQWISRIISWYTKGGFTDLRSGKVYKSDHHFNWTNYEVLNEPNLEGFLRNSKVPWYVTYTEIYDGVVAVLNKDHPEIEISALCVAQDGDLLYDDAMLEYFFNASNHKHNIAPPSYVTYHFYAIPGALQDIDPWPTYKTDPVEAWPRHLFTQAAYFITRAQHANGVIAAGSFGGADVKINVDEVGIIGGRACPVSTLFGKSKAYWNIAASLWGFFYGELARLGYPPGTWKIHGKPVNNNFPCVSMMDWRGDGADTARTWALQMTIDVLGNDKKEVFASNVTGSDATTVSSSSEAWPLPSVVYSIGFKLLASGKKVVLLSNTNGTATAVSVHGASGGTIHTVDENAGHGTVAYSSVKLTSDVVKLAPSAFSLIELK